MDTSQKGSHSLNESDKNHLPTSNTTLTTPGQSCNSTDLLDLSY